VRIAIGSDHAGFELKQLLLEHLRTFSEHEMADVGTHDSSPVDYPDFAEAVGRAVLDDRADRGILICGSGVGASVAANKMLGIRAGLCHDTYSAHQGVEHDDMNVLVLGARIIGQALAKELVDAFVRAEFTREDRHMRRLKKIASLEERFGKSSKKEFVK
jgi:RpiB/LacA/LacB family sugar-phosphate isomerase